MRKWPRMRLQIRFKEEVKEEKEEEEYDEEKRKGTRVKHDSVKRKQSERPRERVPGNSDILRTSSIIMFKPFQWPLIIY